MHDLFIDIGIILIVTTVIGLIGRALKQPLVIAYIAAGILMGPTGQGWLMELSRWLPWELPRIPVINNVQLINTLSVFGVILLLFMVGLEMNIRELKGLKKSILLICVGQIVLTFLFGYGMAFSLLKNHVPALLAGMALMFSSTIIGVKILSDKKDLNSLYGKITIGILLAQDLVAIMALVLLSSLRNGDGIGSIEIMLIMVKLIGLFGFTIVWSRYVLPKLFSAIAHSSELVFLTAIANCFLLAGMAYLLNSSIEIGAFLAGISLASLPHQLQLISKIRPLRDFFLILFFVSLGLHFKAENFSTSLPLLGALMGFAVLLKPLFVILIVIVAGFKKRTAFMSGVSLGQISEFSLIILNVALAHRLITSELLSVMTLVMIVSILLSTQLAWHSHKIFLKVGKYLHFLEVGNPQEKLHSFKKKIHGHIILCGYAGMGERILRSIKKARRKHVVVDINPEHIETLIAKKTPYIFGDITDPEVLELLNTPKAEILISTVSRYEDNVILLDYARRHNKNLVILMEAVSAAQAMDLYDRGADYVILSEYIGGDHASLLLEDLYVRNHDRFFHHKDRHIEFLKQKLGMALK